MTTKFGFNQYTKPSVTNGQAAKMLGVSEAIVKVAKRVAEKAAPQIKEMVTNGELRLDLAKQVIGKSKHETPKHEQLAELQRINAEREAAKTKARAEADRKARADAKGQAPAVPKTNQAMKDVDDFKAKWLSFSDVQRRAFVMMFKDELATILDGVRQQEAILGAAA